MPPGKDRRRDQGSRGALDLATAPILGSRFIFPTRFNAAVARLLDNPDSVGLSPGHSRWYFGASLKLELDPALLKRRISDFVFDRRGVRWTGVSFLDGADWSAALAPLIDSPVHREIGELIDADLHFRETRAYCVQVRAAAAGRAVRRNGIPLAGEAEIEAYYRYCVGLIASIRRHGVVRRRALDTLQAPRIRHRNARPPALDRSERDIGVAINDNGELVRHLAGKHRTAIAQALGLPSIPVEVRLVHVGWLAREMEKTGLPGHLALRHALGRLARDLTPLA